jgi:hypothetical protein
MLIDVALLVGVAPGDGVCMPVAAREGWTVAVGVADLAKVGEGVVVRVALGSRVGVDVVVTVGDGVVAMVGDEVSVSVSSKATCPLIVFPFA